MNPIVKRQIEKLNDCITKSILKKVKDKKKILLTLSGGHDTRVVLSILLKNNIHFHAVTIRFSKGDIKIAKRICKDLELHHYIYNDISIEKKWQMVDELKKNYDILLVGTGFSEWMCALHKLYMSYNKLKEHNTEYIERTLKDECYSPMSEWDCINIIKDIPIVYLAGGYIQKELIKMNYPKLLKYPFTYFDWRHWLMNKFYPHIVDFIYNSYFREKGRNYFESKKEKKRWK